MVWLTVESSGGQVEERSFPSEADQIVNLKVMEVWWGCRSQGGVLGEWSKSDG